MCAPGSKWSSRAGPPSPRCQSHGDQQPWQSPAASVAISAASSGQALQQQQQPQPQLQQQQHRDHYQQQQQHHHHQQRQHHHQQQQQIQSMQWQPHQPAKTPLQRSCQQWSTTCTNELDATAGLFVHEHNDESVNLEHKAQHGPAATTQAQPSHPQPSTSSGTLQTLHVPTTGLAAAVPARAPSDQLLLTAPKTERSCDGLASQNSGSSWGRDTINLYIQSLSSMHQWSAYGAGETALTTPNGMSAVGTPAMMTTACSLASAGSAAWVPQEPGELRLRSTEGVVFTSLRRLSSQGLAAHNQQQQEQGPEAGVAGLHGSRLQQDQSLRSNQQVQGQQQVEGAEQQKASEQRQRRVSWQDSDQLPDLPGMSLSQRTSSVEAAAAAGVSSSGRELSSSEQIMVLQQQCVRLRAHRQYLLKVLQQQESQQQQLKQAHATTLAQLCQLQVRGSWGLR